MYPGLTVTEILSKAGHELLWVGTADGIEAKLVQRAGLPFESIQAAGVHGVSLKKLPGNLWKLWKGYQDSKAILKRFKPDAMLFTGGFVAVPMAIAGRHIPSLLYVPDIEPGLALKTLGRFAKKIAITTEDTKMYYKSSDKLVMTGYPLREDLKQWDKTEALDYFHFDPSIPTVLFMGGSTGARSINNAVIDNAERLIEKYQVIHLVGHLDWEIVSSATQNLGPRYQAFPYLHEIGAAMAAADLVVSRSGASALGEYPFFGLPAVLVPYPYAWRYQKVNADYLVERGAAILLEDQNLMSDLWQTVDTLMQDPGELTRMAAAMRALRHPNAAESIAQLLYGMAEAS